jgi:hypothetical protein
MSEVCFISMLRSMDAFCVMVRLARFLSFDYASGMGTICIWTESICSLAAGYLSDK